MLLNRTIITVIFIIISNSLKAQETISLTQKDSVITQSWQFGLGYNVVDDSATPFGPNVFNLKDNWNAVPYPSSISIGRYFKSGLETKVIVSYNKYKVGKTIDGQINSAERDYLALDGNLSYNLNKIIGDTGWFNPFVQIGAGYSSIGKIGRTTANAGFGFNTWFNDNWGLNFNTMGKWGLKEGSTKQVQHTAGVVYRFGLQKEITTDGLEKLELINALEQRQQQVQDSIINAKELEKKLAKEKEINALEAVENAKKEQEAMRKNKMEQEIKSIESVYFALNSSYLTPASKNILSKLALVLNANPTMVIEISSYTDSRGTDNYNLWLSERRVNQTIQFLLEKGIDKTKLVGKAFGEKELVNECDNSKICSEEKHKENRRSQFKLVNY